MSQSVLIVKLSSLGDIIMALPAVERLKRQEPALGLSWLVEARHRSILEGHPALDEVLSLDTFAPRRHPLSPRSWLGLWQQVVALRRRHFDVVVDLQGLTKSAVVARLSGARRRVGLPRRAVREMTASWLVRGSELAAPASRHVSELYRQVLDGLVEGREPASQPLEEPRLPVVAAELAAVRLRLRREGLAAFAVLNPGGGWVTKRWPLERYEALGFWLLEHTPLGLFVSYGPGEEPLAERLLACWASPRAVGFATSVRELAALLGEARLFVGSDTGPYHLARAMGTPTLGLFGPTDPARNGPLNGRGEVLWEGVPCSPCHLRDCPTAIECIDRLDVERVVSRVRWMLDQPCSPSDTTA